MADVVAPEETEEVVPAVETPEETPEGTESPETPTETPEPEAPEAQAEEVEEPEAPEEKPLSKRKSDRIQALEALVGKLKQQQPADAPKASGGLDYEAALDADPEVIKQLKADREAAIAAAYRQGNEQAQSIQFHTRLEIDAPRIETKYPVFDKDSADFNPVVANAVNQWYLATVGYNAQTNTVTNANVRYAEFVEGIMELADEMSTTKSLKSTANIAKQAAATGLRPSANKVKGLNLNQAPTAMTNEELEAVIAQAMPK